MKRCYDCCNYKTGVFCGYEQSLCERFGSLDVDQSERHPDTTAETCEFYNIPYVEPRVVNEKLQQRLDEVKRRHEIL